MADLPLVAVFLNTLLRLIRLFLETLIGIESTKEIHYSLPAGLEESVHGQDSFCKSSVKQL